MKDEGRGREERNMEQMHGRGGEEHTHMRTCIARTHTHTHTIKKYIAYSWILARSTIAL